MNVEITVDSGAVLAAFNRLQAAARDTTPLMRAVATVLLSQTEPNFDLQGRPDWVDLRPSTILQRAKQGTWPGKILQRSAGGLAASVFAQADRDSAFIGVGKVYAAIHQFGGQAGRGRKVAIPARPFLPIIGSGPSAQLAPYADQSIRAIIEAAMLKWIDDSAG